jgi:hypothetical protein
MEHDCCRERLHRRNRLMALTTADLIRTLQTYPSDTVVHFIGEAIVFDAPDGTQAKPLFRWVEPDEDLDVGSRVCKFGYPDTGTVFSVFENHSATSDSSVSARVFRPVFRPMRYFVVQWDSTGQSTIERKEDLGLVLLPQSVGWSPSARAGNRKVTP